MHTSIAKYGGPFSATISIKLQIPLHQVSGHVQDNTCSESIEINEPRSMWVVG